MSFIEIGEGVAADGGPEDSKKKKEEEDDLEPCRRIYLHAFQGYPSTDLAAFRAFMDSLDEHEAAGTNGPDGIECLLFAGHVGISFDTPTPPIYGFTPNAGENARGWEVMRTLMARNSAYPGQVGDDSAVFAAARSRGLEIRMIEYVYPESEYNNIVARFQQELASTALTYSLPGGGGNCNCATWPAEIGIDIPHHSGAMMAYVRAIRDNDVRQEGPCRDD